jgi:hypothetical protein
LIDQLAIAQSQFLFWTQRLTVRAMNQARGEDHKLEKDGSWVPPRVTVAQWTEEAAQMADRWHRIFQRTLRNLRDLRRYATQVVVQQAGQINIGDRQVNIATVPAEHPR